MTATRTMTWNRFPFAGTDIAPTVNITGNGFNAIPMLSLAEGETLVRTRVSGWALFGTLITASGATFSNELWNVQVPCFGVIATAGPGGGPVPNDPFLTGTDQQNWVTFDAFSLNNVSYFSGDGEVRQEFIFSFNSLDNDSRGQRRREFGGDPVDIYGVYADGGQGLGTWYDDPAVDNYQGYRTLALEVSMLIEGAAA